MLEWILNKLFRHLDITKEINGVTTLYLRRWFLWGDNGDDGTRTKARLCLHKITRSDDDRDPHTHPWRWQTLILAGGYIDERYVQTKWGREGPVMVPMKVGTFARRYPSHLHRVIITGKPSWSLVRMEPKTAEWGFVTPGNEWVHHQKYLGLAKPHMD